MKAKRKFYFYLARCNDNSLYSGSTVDLKKREQRHNKGLGSKYARSRRPIKIVYFEKYRTLAEARLRESQIKRWRKTEKEKLIKK